VPVSADRLVLSGDWKVDGDAGVPLDKLLFFSFSRLEMFDGAFAADDVAFVKLPAADVVFADAIRKCCFLAIDVRIFCIFQIESVMLLASNSCF
jgi:hypothetical protein